MIKRGSTRTVILMGNYAYKFPSCHSWKLFLHGLLANMQERLFSATGWEKLCPVTFSLPGGWLAVMKRASPITDQQFEEIDFDKWCEVEDEGFIPVERKIDSFGIIDGKIVAIDYGS